MVSYMNDGRGRDTTLRRQSVNLRSPSERLEPGRAPRRPGVQPERLASRTLARTVRVVSSLLTVLLLLTAATAAAGFLLYYEFERPGPLTAARTIVIPKGEARIAIAERLEREGIISNRWIFIASHLAESAFGSKRTIDLKAGEYEIQAAASMQSVLQTLSDGKSILYKITIPEGQTSQQIVERLRSEPSLTGDIDIIPPEGSLLPSTYHFSKGTERREILTRMQDEMQRVIDEAWEKRGPNVPVANKAEAVILASIVEKETGQADERHRVAAVFANRIKKGMRLQSDPTIIYGIVAGQGSLGRSITRSDIDTRTPYNTYQINGLPPTPICNPGRDAIEASVNPADTKDLYFVADGTGGHAFSASLKEHNEAVANWRKIERQARARAADEPVSAGPGSAADLAEPGTVPVNATSDDIAPANGAADAAAATAAVTDVPLPVRKPRRTQ